VTVPKNLAIKLNWSGNDMESELPFTTKIDGCYYTFSLTTGWERTRYAHLVAARNYKVNVFVPGKHPKRTWLLEL
jgi:hypothetical protein